MNNKVLSSSTVELNPELIELKRQIFAGFETLIKPLKEEIKELKEDQKVLFECDQITNSHKLERKLIKNDEKHRKLESRISLLEDQLLEKNVIFRGLYEDEYEDKKDIKVQVVKAIANTMSGEDYEAKKALAGKNIYRHCRENWQVQPFASEASKSQIPGKRRCG